MDHLDDDVESIEVALLTEGVHRLYGFDFRDYSYPSLKRRILKRMYAELALENAAIKDVLGRKR